MVASANLCHCSSTAELEHLAVDGDVLTRMQNAVRTLLQGLGEDPSRDGLVDTPRVSAHCDLSVHSTFLDVHKR